MKDPMPRWMTDPNYNKYARSKTHELRLATMLGGRRLPNSGGARRSRWDLSRSQGGDIETPDFLVEHKRTSKKSITLKKEWAEKTKAGAREIGKRPALILTFDEQGQPFDLVVVRLADLQCAASSLVVLNKKE